MLATMRTRLFSRWWEEEAKSPTITEQQPPPYSNSDSNSNNHPLPPAGEIPPVKASDTPQWLWSQKQCRKWITAVCMEYLDYSLEEAVDVAMHFKGMGNYLYAMTNEHWKSLFHPNEAHGASVYSVLLSKKEEKGAIPAGLSFPHLRK